MNPAEAVEGPQLHGGLLLCNSMLRFATRALLAISISPVYPLGRLSVPIFAHLVVRPPGTIIVQNTPPPRVAH